jgi:hypothetical protein
VGKKSRRNGPKSGSAGTDPLDQALSATWRSIAAGDILSAELHASALIALASFEEAAGEEGENLIAAFIDIALEQQRGPVAAAFLRLLAALGPRAVKREASTALAELTQEGIYPPGWVTGIGKPALGQAWRTYDVYGDRETIVITFSYPDQPEHGFLFSLDYAEVPSVAIVAALEDAAQAREKLRDSLDPHERFAEITPADARSRIEEPLARAEAGAAGVFLDANSKIVVPVARLRVRRLPDESARAPGYTAADRAAVVTEFLHSPQAAEAGDREVARFWAEVLTGYSSRFPGAAPGRIGPLTLMAALLGHASITFSLTAAQRAGQAAAVTAWVRWSAIREDLDGPATERLLDSAARTLDEFTGAYDDAESAAARSYVRDVAASDIDVDWLRDLRDRRTLAAPFPWSRDPELADVDATSPEGRATLTEHEFASCVPAGEQGKAFTAAAGRVVEELWTGEPPETWRVAEKHLETGEDRHGVLHALIDRRLGR